MESASVKFSQHSGESAYGTYPVVIANILKPVLLEFAAELVRRLDPAPGGVLILSGLIEKRRGRREWPSTRRSSAASLPQSTSSASGAPRLRLRGSIDACCVKF